ncbi:MAG: hypothetical protein L0H83_16300, partial [Salinisphaera sp.]|nr:hypothetical protein [Salinisphaera sp.]
MTIDTLAAKALAGDGHLIHQEARLAKHIPYTRLVDAHTVETKDGHLLQVLKLDGVAFETADQDELNHLKDVRNTILRGIASQDISVWHHIVRRHAGAFPAGSFRPGFAADLNRRWAAKVTAKKMFVNELYLTVVKRRPKGAFGVVDKAMRKAQRAARRAGEAARPTGTKELTAVVDMLLGNLRRYGARRLGMAHEARFDFEHSEVLGFLNMLLCNRAQKVIPPHTDLSEYLGTAQLFFGEKGIECRGVNETLYGGVL